MQMEIHVIQRAGMSPTQQGVGTDVSSVSAERAAPDDVQLYCDGCRACKHASKKCWCVSFTLQSNTRQVYVHFSTICTAVVLYCRHGWISCLGGMCRAAKQDPLKGSGDCTQEVNRAVTNHQRIWTLIMDDSMDTRFIPSACALHAAEK